MPLVPTTTDFIGPIAALATSTLWTFTSVLFTAGGRRIGATRVNGFRLMVALPLHWITFVLLTGAMWPRMNDSQLVALVLSGLIGFAICDQAMFIALVDIGARRALLMMTTSPIFATAMAWAFLHERPGPLDLLGIAMTLAGVAWVTLGRNAAVNRPANYRRGVLLAILAAACQAIGFLLSKRGMGHGVEASVPLDPQSATLVRVFFGLLGVIPIYLWNLRRERLARLAAGDDATPRDAARIRHGLALTAAGAVTGPFLGVWCSLIAIDRTPLGVAQTLCGLSPVMILPVAWLVWKERVTWQAAVGALLAVAGSALLFMA